MYLLKILYNFAIIHLAPSWSTGKAVNLLESSEETMTTQLGPGGELGCRSNKNSPLGCHGWYPNQHGRYVMSVTPEVLRGALLALEIMDTGGCLSAGRPLGRCRWSAWIFTSCGFFPFLLPRELGQADVAPSHWAA